MTSEQLRSFPNSPVVRIKTAGSSRRLFDSIRPAATPRKLDAAIAVTRPKEDQDDLRLPVQLRSPGRGLPAPLVWVSPASLARSPMVSLRRLDDNGIELERSLTMSFPARRRNMVKGSKKFEVTSGCLECLMRGGGGSVCRQQCLDAVTIK